MKLYEVEWEDSASANGWQRREGADFGTTLCHSVGYLMKKDKHLVALAQSWDNHGSISAVISIPRAVVRSMRKL